MNAPSSVYQRLVQGGLQANRSRLTDIVSRPPADPELLAAIERGDFQTKPATPPAWLRRAKMPPGFGPQGEHARQARVRDRTASRGRKRGMGGAGCMPHAIRCHYTEGERAALTVVALEVKRRGRCDMPVDKIAALAGVSPRTVQYAFASAIGARHIEVEYRREKGKRGNRPNRITIVSAEWLTWIKRGPSLDTLKAGIEGCKGVHTTKKREFYSDRRVGHRAKTSKATPCRDGPKGPGVKGQGQGRASPETGGARHG
jgi:hypothetical protein